MASEWPAGLALVLPGPDPLTVGTSLSLGLPTWGTGPGGICLGAVEGVGEPSSFWRGGSRPGAGPRRPPEGEPARALPVRTLARRAPQ